MKLLKKLFVFLAVFVLVATLILWTLAKSISPEVVKDYVSTQLTSLTNQQSQIEGDISWQLFPRPGIKITRMQIGNHDGQNRYSVRLENVLFNLKITPLLRGKLVFSELNVNGFQIIINPDAKSSIVKKTLGSPPKKTGHIAEQFAIENILLTHGEILLQKNHQIIKLANSQIGAERFNLKKQSFPLQFKSQLTITANGKSLVQGHINFKGNTALSLGMIDNPLTAFQTTPLAGQLMMQDLKVDQFKINKIRSTVKTKSGVLLLNPLTLTMYHGESVGDLSYDFATKKLTFNQTATNLNGSKLIHDLVKKRLFKGSVDFSIHALANMNQNWLETVLGKGSLTIKDGVVESVNLNKVIDETSTKINKLLSGKKNEVTDVLQLSQFDNPAFFKGHTNFKLLTIEYTLQNEKLLSNSLVLQTDRLQLKGSGELNLKDNNLDSHLQAKVSLTDPEVDKIQQLLGGNFPLLIKGNLVAPTVLPDLKIINPILSQFWLKEALAKPVKAIHKQIKTLLTNKND
ncbi:AsmA family protein [Legionella clemsonensis]|uniref:Putative assembly protein n=1 Tax=Legionella clemsonensis TaxID=1867846 RepID=A0A222P150_9GAMM|nr:AsmA family protein [Legionella clemsonensis]ASQ45567.1 putative assembly protein [Legionella clemsonensis]